MEVIKISWVYAYILDVWFKDGSYKQINFANFLFSTEQPMVTKYRDISLFKKAKIEYGDIVWGKDGEMAFTPESIYSGKVMGKKCYEIDGECVWAYSRLSANEIASHRKSLSISLGRPTSRKRVKLTTKKVNHAR